MAKSRPAPKAPRPTKKESRREQEAIRNVRQLDTTPPEEPFKPKIQRVTFKTENQKLMWQLMKQKRLVIALGPAGVGKTFLSTIWACEQLDAKLVSKLVFTRPAVEAADEHLGFLPGELEEKFAPWFEPFRRILVARYGQSAIENMMKRGKLEIAPLGYMRGMTYDNCVIMLDEAQNSTPKQMKLLLTRMGENSTTIVDGDITQKDIKGQSGIEDIMDRFNDMPAVGKVEFQEEDIVRDDIVREFLFRYRIPQPASNNVVPITQATATA